jgi:hypothetical protein
LRLRRSNGNRHGGFRNGDLLRRILAQPFLRADADASSRH